MSNETGISGISLGAGTLLVPLRTLYSHFAPFGYSEPEFREFVLALGCAPILTPTGDYLVHYFRFLLAIEIATMLGRRAFSRDAPLTPTDISSHWEEALTLLLASRKYHGLANPPVIRATLSEVARRLLSQSTRILATLTKRSREQLSSVIPLTLEDPSAPSPFPAVAHNTVPILPPEFSHAARNPQPADSSPPRPLSHQP